MLSGGPDHPSMNVILRGPHSKISAMGPEFLPTALRAITVSGPSTVYHLVFTPILPFPYCYPTEECFSTWWKVFNRPHKQVHLLQAIDDAFNDQCQVCICYTRRFFLRSLANENIQYQLWCGTEPVAKSTRQGWYKYRSAVRDTLVYISL